MVEIARLATALTASDEPESKPLEIAVWRYVGGNAELLAYAIRAAYAAGITEGRAQAKREREADSLDDARGFFG